MILVPSPPPTPSLFKTMPFRLFCYAPLSVLLLSFSRTGMAEDYFDPAALELSSTEQKTADLHYFSEKGGQMPSTGS